MMGIKSLVLLPASIVFVGALGCSKDQQPPPRTSANTAAAAAAQPAASNDEPPADRSNERDVAIMVSREVKMRCALPDSPSEAPRFDYDDATLRPRGENILDAVAKCLSGGPLQGQTITLVGYADPRGSDAYNLELGRSRAAAARDYLVQRGVRSDQIVTLSRGEQQARGTDELTWAMDRRVEVELGAIETNPEGTGVQRDESEQQPEP